MNKPVMLALDADPAALQITKQLLQNRYGINYEVVCEQSTAHALDLLHMWHTAGSQIAVLIVSLRLPEMTGIDFLASVQPLCPHAKRILLFDRADTEAIKVVLRAVALGQTDYYMVKPSGEPDEAFHQLITDLLVEWTGTEQETFVVVQVIGEQWDAKSHAYRDLLERNGIPYNFFDLDSKQAQALLQQVQRPDGPFPVVILYNGAVFTNPSPAEVADALGSTANPPEGIYDLTIIGGGPAGLSAAVYGASEGLRTLVIEREAIGGQAGTSSWIRNYLGFPRGISGGDLARRAANQATLFGTEFYLLREATALHTDGRQQIITLSDGVEVVSRTVLLTLGVTYRRLGVPALDALTGAGVFYGAVTTEAAAMEEQRVIVVGGGNSAGQAALHLAKYAAQVIMAVRGDSLEETMSDYLIQEIQDKANIQVQLQTEVVDGWGDQRLQGVVLRDAQSGKSQEVATTGLFILIGAEPRTEWLPPSVRRDAKGYLLTGADLIQDGQLPSGWPLDRAPFLLESSLPGVFAAGDVRHRALKRVASAVGEGSIAIHLVHQFLSEQTAG
ncbi:MAG: FAD-dependent oxidoreductase [Caldilineaceae bacterium]|nr:FAD-dependent oxidoreductase [Caldilineaceae bacterium]